MDEGFQKFLDSIAWLAECEIRYQGEHPLGWAQLDDRTGRIEKGEVRKGDLIESIVIARTIWSIVHGRYVGRNTETPSAEGAAEAAMEARRRKIIPRQEH